MALAKFYSGVKSELDSKAEEAGSVYFITDTKELYADIPGGSRTSFGQGDMEEVTRAQVDEIFKRYGFIGDSSGDGDYEFNFSFSKVTNEEVDEIFRKYGFSTNTPDGSFTFFTRFTEITDEKVDEIFANHGLGD